MKTIIQKELKVLWRDGRIKFSLLLIPILLLFSAVTGIKQYNQTNAEYEIAKSKERSIWESQDDKNPHSAAHYGTYAFKPKFALSLFDPGINKYTGNSIFLEAHKRNEAAYSDANDQSGLSRFGNLSLNFVLLYLFPLLILLLGYDSLSKEKDIETLQLIKSQGISLRKIILGKWLSIFLPVFLGVIVLFLVIGILLSTSDEFAYFDWRSLGVLAGSYLLYYMIIVSVVLLVSLLSKSSGMALVFNLSLWILFCFIAPKIATNFSNSMYPYPTKQQFYNAIKVDKEKGLDGHNPWSEQAKILKEETLKEYGVDSVEQLPFNFDGYRMQKGEEHESEVYNKHYNYLKNTFYQQNAVYRFMAAISPFIPLKLLSMDISNTSYIAHWNFSDAAENYRIEKQSFLNNDFKDNSKTGDWGYKMSKEGFKKLPKFVYTPPSLSKILNANVINFMILLIWLLVPAYLLYLFATKL